MSDSKINPPIVSQLGLQVQFKGKVDDHGMFRSEITRQSQKSFISGFAQATLSCSDKNSHKISVGVAINDEVDVTFYFNCSDGQTDHSNPTEMVTLNNNKFSVNCGGFTPGDEIVLTVDFFMAEDDFINAATQVLNDAKKDGDSRLFCFGISSMSVQQALRESVDSDNANRNIPFSIGNDTLQLQISLPTYDELREKKLEISAIKVSLQSDPNTKDPYFSIDLIIKISVVQKKDPKTVFAAIICQITFTAGIVMATDAKTRLQLQFIKGSTQFENYQHLINPPILDAINSGGFATSKADLDNNLKSVITSIVSASGSYSSVIPYYLSVLSLPDQWEHISIFTVAFKKFDYRTVNFSGYPDKVDLLFVVFTIQGINQGPCLLNNTPDQAELSNKFGDIVGPIIVPYGPSLLGGAIFSQEALEEITRSFINNISFNHSKSYREGLAQANASVWVNLRQKSLKIDENGIFIDIDGNTGGKITAGIGGCIKQVLFSCALIFNLKDVVIEIAMTSGNEPATSSKEDASWVFCAKPVKGSYDKLSVTLKTGLGPNAPDASPPIELKSIFGIVLTEILGLFKQDIENALNSHLGGNFVLVRSSAGSGSVFIPLNVEFVPGVAVMLLGRLGLHYGSPRAIKG